MMRKIKLLPTFSFLKGEFSVKKLKKRIYLSLAVFLGIGFLLVIFVIWPLFRDIKRRSEELTLLRTQEDQLLKARKDIGKMKAILLEHETDFERIKTLFINPEDLLGFIDFLEEQARKSGVHFRITSLGLEGEKVSWLSFQVKIAGPFENFLRFLEMLESGPYLLQIVNLNLKRLEKRDIREEEFKNFSLGDIQGFLTIKVFRK